VFIVVTDEDGLFGFDDDYSIFALRESNMLVVVMKDGFIKLEIEKYILLCRRDYDL
jgi:hypothetical protein